MDFDDTAEEAAVRDAARTWLEENAPLRVEGTLATRRKRRDPSPEAQLRHVGACKEWQRRLYDGGWAGITWPTEYGGREAQRSNRRSSIRRWRGSRSVQEHWPLAWAW